jgi:DNA repair protein RecO (recombination protein O)
MEKKINGIVVKSVSYLEADKILTVFSLEEGLITVNVKGVKKAGAKLKACSEPFCFAEFMLASKNNRNTVIGASVYDGFYNLREDIVAFYAGAVVLDFVKSFCPEGEPLPEYFDLVINTLKDICYGDGVKESLLISFLLKALKLSGYGLRLGFCATCGSDISSRVFFDASLGSFYCIDCAKNNMEISFNTYSVLLGAENDYTVDVDNSYLKRALKLINFYIEERVGEKLKSLKDFIDL